MPAPITAERLETRNRERLARAEALLRQLEAARAPFTKDGVVAPLGDLQLELNNLGAECGIYIAMHPDEAVQQLAEKLQREGIELGQRQLQSRPLYDALGAVDPASLDAVERRFIDISRTDMRRAGALLGPAERDRARALRAELTRLGQDHARNIRDDTRHISLEGPHELDGLPADYVEDRMVRTPEALDAFFTELDDASRDAANAELAVLLEEKRIDHPGAATVGEWEWQYYLNRVKTRRFHFDAQEVRPYLEYGRVRQAILDLNSELFGMTFTPVVHEERWHPPVESFEVTIDGEPAGRISLDMHPRERKNKWFFNA